MLLFLYRGIFNQPCKYRLKGIKPLRQYMVKPCNSHGVWLLALDHHNYSQSVVGLVGHDDGAICKYTHPLPDLLLPGSLPSNHLNTFCSGCLPFNLLRCVGIRHQRRRLAAPPGNLISCFSTCTVGRVHVLFTRPPPTHSVLDLLQGLLPLCLLICAAPLVLPAS